MELKTTSGFLLILLTVACSHTQAAIWRKATYSYAVCFGARNTQYGSFKTPASGRVAAVKLVHLYGYVSCNTGSAGHWSFWGCGHGLSGSINVVITPSYSNYMILPPSQFIHHQAGKWSKIPGYDSFSPELVLARFSSPYYVLAGRQFRVWYGEDLVNYTESDNGGRVCSDVYLLYV